jgi:hypothetical protein
VLADKTLPNFTVKKPESVFDEFQILNSVNK